MSARLRLLHAWMAQVEALLPGERVTRCRGLALFALGMIWAGTVRVHQVAAALPLGVRVPSTERRLRRFLANPAVGVETLWQPLLPTLLRRWAGQEVTLVCDPTPHGRYWTVLWIGIVVHRRVLPLAWRLVPQQEPWPQTLGPLWAPLLAMIAAALPPDCTVTLLADRGVSGPTLLDALQPWGWNAVLRLNVGPTQAHRLRLRGAETAGAETAGAETAGAETAGAEWRLWDGVESVGSGWSGRVQIFQDAGWREGYLTIHRAPGRTEWWILFSTRPGGRPRIREYARRSRVEATFADGKTRGWGLEQSRVTDPQHLDRLLLVWHLALWWRHALGAHVIKIGMRAHFDRPDRRERSLVRLGWLWLQHELLHGRCPPLPFRRTADGWHVRGTP